MRNGSTHLTVAHVAKIANCHPNTVRHYDSKGLIQSQRDINGYRRFSLEQALRLRELLSWRGDELPEHLCVSAP